MHFTGNALPAKSLPCWNLLNFPGLLEAGCTPFHFSFVARGTLGKKMFFRWLHLLFVRLMELASCLHCLPFLEFMDQDE